MNNRTKFRLIDYFERQHHYFMSRLGNNKYVCFNCFNPTVNDNSCNNCNSPFFIRKVNTRARIPKKNSSKLKWKLFCAVFFKNIDFEYLWKTRKRSKS